MLLVWLLFLFGLEGLLSPLLPFLLVLLLLALLLTLLLILGLVLLRLPRGLLAWVHSNRWRGCVVGDHERAETWWCLLLGGLRLLLVCLCDSGLLWVAGLQWLCLYLVLLVHLCLVCLCLVGLRLICLVVLDRHGHGLVVWDSLHLGSGVHVCVVLWSRRRLEEAVPPHVGELLL